MRYVLMHQYTDSPRHPYWFLHVWNALDIILAFAHEVQCIQRRTENHEINPSPEISAGMGMDVDRTTAKQPHNRYMTYIHTYIHT